MSTHYRAFDVNITCAEGIERASGFLNFFLNPKPYAVVSVVGASPAAQETPLGKYCSENPVWNFPMRFYLEESKLQENALTLRIQLRRKRISGGHEDIAEVLVPLRNLFHGSKNAIMDENYGSSWLLSPSGGRCGFLYFSYCFTPAYLASA